MRAIVIKKIFFEFDVEGQELILKTDLLEQGIVRVIFETEYYLLGGAEVKTACCTKLSKLRKTSAISSIFNKTFKKNVERSDKMDSFFLSDHRFCEENFFASMQCPKNS